MSQKIGFIGLGNMGRPMAANIARAGHRMIVHDAAGTEARVPEGAEIAGSVAEVANAAEIVLLSLPDGPVVASVAEEIVASNARVTQIVVDLSTIGIEAAGKVHSRLRDARIDYADAPVSGGTAGAAAGTVACMFAGSAEAFERMRPVLSAMAKNLFHVGTEPGQGQAMKLLNNFLSATAMAATSEAIAFGQAQGLDMKLMLDVLNVSSGQNTATLDKFPNRILPERYDAGFTNILMSKDVSLYHACVRAAGTPDRLGATVAGIWERFRTAEPGIDFTRIYPFTRDSK